MLKQNMKAFIAIIYYKLGFKPKCTTFIDEETISMGYGKCHYIGVFEYPLPPKYIKKIFGCTKWQDMPYRKMINIIYNKTNYTSKHNHE